MDLGTNGPRNFWVPRKVDGRKEKDEKIEIEYKNTRRNRGREEERGEERKRK